MSKGKFKKKITAFASSAVMAVTSLVGAVAMPTSAVDESALGLDNYAKLLQYSLYFYDANYCGVGAGEKSAFSWRGDCHTDGTANGGFHDAGDGIICGLTEGFTASTLGWLYYEYKDEFEKTGTYAHFKDISTEFAEFFKNCTTLDGNGNVTKFIYEIGDDGADHSKWKAPELMSRSSSEYYSTTDGASNTAAQYAAALAQQYINFGDEEALTYAKALYDFAAKNRKMTYDQQTYSDKSVEDDIAWAAGWLYIATGEQPYLDANSKDTSTTNDWVNDYYYGGVWLGAALLNAEITGSGWEKPVNYINSIVNQNQNKFYIMNSWGSARHNTLMQTCALIATKHKEQSGADFAEWCKSQMDMILGKNNANVCLVVGYNDVSATSPHHRAASNLDVGDSWQNWYSRDYASIPGSHVLYGALCGGPSNEDFNSFKNDITDATSNEVALDYQVGLVGAAVGLYHIYGTGAVVDTIGDEVTVYAEEIAVANGETVTPPEETTTTTTAESTTTTTTTESTTTTFETTTTETTTAPIMTTTTTSAPSDTNIILLSPPNKTVYEIGEELNLDGAMASANGTENGGNWDIFATPVTSPVFVLDTSEFDNTKAGTYTIYVSVTNGEGATTSFEVEVVDNSGNTGDINYGDANEDGKVGISDAVLIMQSLSNPNEYSLTEQGRKNADVIGDNDGVTALDALVIEKVEAKLINASDLPTTNDKIGI